mmetsp:Transcript_17714/g.41185  ORF Transcript_17714/g.41185 Transcript_17714/m.41185 type:complete len:317 (-) Transcript_17714:36-986(-)
MVKVKTKASSGPMRWMDDVEAPVARGPSEQGNDFDIRMSEEPDGMLAAKKIVKVIKEKGVCVIQANAPQQLLVAASEEAENLWDDGKFAPPLRIHDERSRMEAQIWQQTLADEEKVVWLRPQDAEANSKSAAGQTALRLLANNMADFGAGLGTLLKEECGCDYDRHGHSFLSCYTGDRNYHLHLDNPHLCDVDKEQTRPDNGLRLSAVYFLNPYWDPQADRECGGGLDLYLTNPKECPSTAAEAKKADKLRIAPHADTLLLFLSERLAHQVVSTKGSQRWMCMQMWYINGAAMSEMPRKLMALREAQQKQDDDDSD